MTRRKLSGRRTPGFPVVDEVGMCTDPCRAGSVPSIGRVLLFENVTKQYTGKHIYDKGGSYGPSCPVPFVTR